MGTPCKALVDGNGAGAAPLWKTSVIIAVAANGNSLYDTAVGLNKCYPSRHSANV